MPPRFRSLVVISCFLVFTFWLATRTETAKNYGGQTLDKLIQESGVKIDLGKSGGVNRLPFPGEKDAEEERKKRPKPADGQVEIGGSQTPFDDKVDAIPSKVEISPEEPIRVVLDDGFTTNSSLEPQDQFKEEYNHITE